MNRLLVVDDDATTRTLLGSALASEGYEVSKAGDGDEALRMLERERPDMLITDLIMPGMDGLTLCKAVKGNPDYSELSIVALTGGDYPEELTGLCDVFVRKPIDIARLLDTLEQLQTAKLLSTATTSAQALRW